MNKQIEVGDNVRLLALSEAFLGDLPATEQASLLALVGKVFAVRSIDKSGFYWIDSNPMEIKTETGDSYWTDSSFSVEPHEVEYVGPTNTTNGR